MSGRRDAEAHWIAALRRVLCEVYPENIEVLAVQALRRCEHERCLTALEIWDWALGDLSPIWGGRPMDHDPAETT